MRTLFRVIVMGSALLLGACGFHLREQAQLPPGLQRIHLEIADQGSLLYRDLPAALERSGATVEENAGSGIASLRIPVSSLAPQPLSVGSSARVREYSMRYHVEIEVVDASGATVMPRQAIDLNREYTFDETQALGVAAQEDELRKQLQRDMVQAILRRIAALSRPAG